MTKAPISLQELRRRIYRKAKSDKTYRFWGIFVYITKPETLEETYRAAKRNGGAPGLDGQTFEDFAVRCRRRHQGPSSRSRHESCSLEFALLDPWWPACGPPMALSWRVWYVRSLAAASCVVRCTGWGGFS